jgi:hypothetical protein
MSMLPRGRSCLNFLRSVGVNFEQGGLHDCGAASFGTAGLSTISGFQTAVIGNDFFFDMHFVRA